MPSSRRRYLATLGALGVGGLAGCSTVTDSGDPPAGSLRFENRSDLPHTLGFAVTGVGARHGDDPASVTGEATVRPAQRRLRATAALEPGETRTYESAFTESVWYRVAFAMDADPVREAARRVAFTPDADGDDGRGQYLGARVLESGEFSWVVGGTENEGAFG